jgi:thymidylate kinase
LALKTPSSGRLISLDSIDGRGVLPAARKLLKSKSAHGGISLWDASGIFFEVGNLEVDDRPSPRTLILLYAADLFFRLRWEIVPALEEGKCVVAAPYVETAFAFGAIAGLPKKWVHEVFRFAPKASEGFRLKGSTSHRLGRATSGFVEFCSDVMKHDLRPEFAAYFDDLECRGARHSV